MKIFIVLFVINIIHDSKQQFIELTDEQMDFKDECQKETNADLDKAAEKLAEMHFPDDTSFKCFLKCILVKLKGMTETGDLSANNLKKVEVPDIIPEEAVPGIVDKCKGEKSSNPCETAYKFGKCVTLEVVMMLQG